MTCDVTDEEDAKMFAFVFTYLFIISTDYVTGVPRGDKALGYVSVEHTRMHTQLSLLN